MNLLCRQFFNHPLNETECKTTKLGERLMEEGHNFIINITDPFKRGQCPQSCEVRTIHTKLTNMQLSLNESPGRFQNYQ